LSGKAAAAEKKESFSQTKQLFFHNFSSGTGEKALKFNSFYLCDAAVNRVC
jgi:hypothetical protein